MILLSDVELMKRLLVNKINIIHCTFVYQESVIKIIYLQLIFCEEI